MSSQLISMLEDKNMLNLESCGRKFIEDCKNDRPAIIS